MKSILFLSILSLALLSCEVESIPFVTDTPVVANTDGAYSFTLVASDYTETRRDRVNFNGENVQFSLTIAGVGSGTGSLVITDLDGNVIREESLSQNKVVAQTDIDIEGASNVALSFDNFSGSVVLAISDGE